MNKSRRNALRAVAIVGATLVLPVRDVFGGRLELTDVVLPPAGGLMRGDFEQHVGSVFTARTVLGAGEPLTLIAVSDVPAAEAAGQQGSATTFIAVFSSPTGNVMSQGTYTIEHPVLGEMPLFIVPTGGPTTSSTQVYVATFDAQPMQHLGIDVPTRASVRAPQRAKSGKKRQ